MFSILAYKNIWDAMIRGNYTWAVSQSKQYKYKTCKEFEDIKY